MEPTSPACLPAWLPTCLSPTPHLPACLAAYLQGVSSHLKFKAVGELQPNGKREVYFEANGVPRVVEVSLGDVCEGKKCESSVRGRSVNQV